MKKLLTFASFALLAWSVLHAVPAKPGTTVHRQSDGTDITIRVVGDEFFHCILTEDNLPLQAADNGDLYYCTEQGITAQLAHSPSRRDAAELSFIAAQRQHMSALAETPRDKARRASARRRVGQTQVPTLGSPRVPIILVEYTDKKMSHTLAQFEAQYKTGAKSVLQYFTDQSNGKYTPQYDIYGIYPLDNNRATYGRNSGGNDVGVARMVCEAIDKAGDDIDWSLYDNDGDGEADVCIVVYAGVGEAQASSTVPNSIWPCQWSLSDAEYYSDGDGPRTRNNVKIDRFAVFNEIAGSRDSGTTMDGIGTFCHEFSHCLGLPDFYETTYGSGYFGMGGWSLMNSGCYNGGTIDGDTPIGYSGYEKDFMSWISLVEPTPNTQYTLPVFNAKSEDTDMALKITALHPNEYFILENRRKQGWDQYIADEGVLITHFTYVAGRWEANTVNNQAVQLATVIPADNSLSSYSESADLFGETNHEFTATSKPAMTANMSASGSLGNRTGQYGTIDKPVTEIVLNNDKTASLWYIKAPLPELTVTPESLAMKVAAGKTTTATFEVGGVSINGDVTLTVDDENGVFAVEPATLTAQQALDGATVTVTFAPQAIAAYAGTVTVAAEGADPVVVTLGGEGMIESETPVMQPADETQVKATSFRADWTDSSPAENVKSYTLYVDYVSPVKDPVLLEDADFSDLTAVTETYWWWTNYTNVASSADQYLPEGWTCGSALYIDDGAIIAASDITTGSYDIPQGYDKISAVVTAGSFNEEDYGTAGLQIKTSGGAVSETQSFDGDDVRRTFVVDTEGGSENITFARTNYPLVSRIAIYAGDITTDANAPLLAEIEQGDSATRVIEGITDTHYLVSGLIAGGTYTYKVEATYVNDTQSLMSNIETVTLRESDTLPGDVNGDGVVDIADINILINIMLDKDSADRYDGRADQTGDGNIDIADINAVINIMLNK